MGFINDVKNMFNKEDKLKKISEAKEARDKKNRELFEKTERDIAEAKADGVSEEYIEKLRENAKLEERRNYEEFQSNKSKDLLQSRRDETKRIIEQRKTEFRERMLKNSTDKNVKTVDKKADLNVEKMKQFKANAGKALIGVTIAAILVGGVDLYNESKFNEEVCFSVMEQMYENGYPMPTALDNEWSNDVAKLKGINMYAASILGGQDLAEKVAQGNGIEFPSDEEFYQGNLKWKEQAKADLKDDGELNNSTVNVDVEDIEETETESRSMGGK